MSFIRYTRPLISLSSIFVLSCVMRPIWSTSSKPVEDHSTNSIKDLSQISRKVISLLTSKKGKFSNIISTYIGLCIAGTGTLYTIYGKWARRIIMSTSLYS